ncbi:MAG: 16S rRNA (uracil(1498)-N(3))-methyltransferase [Slackia sp.]|nr:16S rRNA (uracil(1498)-N(3))-methyltransferase [Slackia sp.]
MSLHHFFLDGQVLELETEPCFALRLSSEDAKHARVLRLEPGEHISVVDAAQDYFECEVVSVDDDIVVRIAQKLDAPDDGPSVVLVQGLAKGDKMDDIVRHATEVGISAFVPLSCSRSVVKLDAKKAAAKTKRWQAIAHSAAMQAGRTMIPEVSEPLDVASAARIFAEATAVLVCWEECPATSTIASALGSAFEECGVRDIRDARIVVVVGPEGGLSAAEVEVLTAGKRAWPVTLGPSILRTETAGVVAPALVLYECGRQFGAYHAQTVL